MTGAAPSRRTAARAFLPAVLLLIGCRLHRGPIEPEAPRGPTRDSLFLLDQSRGDSASARGGSAGALAFLDSNVIYLRAGLPMVYKRSAVRSLFEAARIPTSNTWQPLGGDVSRDLRSGYTFGIWARGGSGSQPLRVERYLAFWQRRGSSGPWRIVAYAEFAGQSGPEIKLSSAELSPPERQLSKSEAEATIRLRLADSSFSDEADRIGLSYAFSHTVARDGALFVGTRLVVGSEAISEALATQNRGASITWRPVYASVASSGDLGFTVGDFISTGTGPSGAAVQRFGKYLSVWRKQSDGDWRLLMSVGNATPARAPQ